MIKNIMSVDLEDHFCNLPYTEWDKYESRVVQNTKIILNLFEKYGAKATFFTVGHIAEKHPELIEEIISKGHEIASHSHYHIDLRKMDKKSFETDLRKSIETLERISGEKVQGFRAPYYSINEKNFWVFDVLRKYVKYDSSIFPVKTPLYGIPSAPRFTYKMSDSNPLIEDKNGCLIEIPPATLKFPIIGNVPIAGGFYLRVLPTWLLIHGIKKLNKKKISAMCYIHPHDLDPARPRIEGTHDRAFWGLKKAPKKFENLLRNFKFSTVQDILLKQNF